MEKCTLIARSIVCNIISLFFNFSSATKPNSFILGNEQTKYESNFLGNCHSIPDQTYGIVMNTFLMMLTQKIKHTSNGNGNTQTFLAKFSIISNLKCYYFSHFKCHEKKNRIIIDKTMCST